MSILHVPVNYIELSVLIDLTKTHLKEHNYRMVEECLAELTKILDRLALESKEASRVKHIA